MEKEGFQITSKKLGRMKGRMLEAAGFKAGEISHQCPVKAALRQV
ncbi:MAG: hypothetical protein ACP5DC_08030 [Halothiobacillaceae bacterium]